MRLKLTVRGAVQGVGIRPFVFRLATKLGLTGWVNNSPQGVFIEVEGTRAELEKFLLRLETEKPPRSSIQSLEASWLDAIGYKIFEIRPSETSGDKSALVLPDIATCPDCLREIFDPDNRRHGYPFTNCTNCGPRFSLIESLPYDRANTSMKSFTMCPQCQAEYDDPRDRRFHAQPNACPVCGPRLELWPGSHVCKNAEHPRSHERGYDALLAAAQAIREGKIVAVKGLGGFHLMVARAQRCGRPPSARAQASGRKTVRTHVSIARKRESRMRSLTAGRTPAPLARSAHRAAAATQIRKSAIRNPSHRRFRRSRQSLPRRDAALHAAASPADGRTRFSRRRHQRQLERRTDLHRRTRGVGTAGGIADVFLVHNRPIVRHVDDSIVRVMLDRELVLRRARGYAPLPIHSSNREIAKSRNSQNHFGRWRASEKSVALSVGNQVFISQHIGDLETEQANSAFRRVIADFENFTRPNRISSRQIFTRIIFQRNLRSNVGSAGRISAVPT